MEAVGKAEDETGERKGHYLNVTAPDFEQMIERAELAKWCRMIGADHVHNGTVVGKLEADRDATVAVNDLLREDFVAADPSSGVYFDQAWASLPGLFPVASGGHPRLAHARPGGHLRR